MAKISEKLKRIFRTAFSPTPRRMMMTMMMMMGSIRQRIPMGSIDVLLPSPAALPPPRRLRPSRCPSLVRHVAQQRGFAFWHRSSPPPPPPPPSAPSPPPIPNRRDIPRLQRGIPEKQRIPNVKFVIAVASAKGGVGKSTSAVNLTLALKRLGVRAGILDVDLFGPSIPTMFNLKGPPALNDQQHMRPLVKYEIPSMSLGYLVASAAPIVWRGLMVMKTLQQLLFQVDWSPGLDVLVLDLPPGTGDTQLTLTQSVALDGAVVISTPQEIALADVRRGVSMFQKVQVPVIGLVENMSHFICPHCDHGTDIFGSEGVQRLAKELQIDYLGAMPLIRQIRELSDIGEPIMVRSPDSTAGKMYTEMASKIWKTLQNAQ